MKKYIDILLINVISMLVGIGIYFLTNERIEILGAVIATGISLALGIRQYKTEDDKLFKELFSELNAKYDLKFNNKLEEIVDNSERDKNYKLLPEDKKLIIDYINFCAEEYLWRTKDRIPTKVWISWENGMVYYFNKPIINEILIKEKTQKNSYYGLFERLEKRVENLY